MCVFLSFLIDPSQEAVRALEVSQRLCKHLSEEVNGLEAHYVTNRETLATMAAAKARSAELQQLKEKRDMQVVRLQTKRANTHAMAFDHRTKLQTLSARQQVTIV